MEIYWHISVECFNEISIQNLSVPNINLHFRSKKGAKEPLPPTPTKAIKINWFTTEINLLFEFLKAILPEIIRRFYSQSTMDLMRNLSDFCYGTQMCFTKHLFRYWMHSSRNYSKNSSWNQMWITPHEISLFFTICFLFSKNLFNSHSDNLFQKSSIPQKISHDFCAPQFFFRSSSLISPANFYNSSKQFHKKFLSRHI